METNDLGTRETSANRTTATENGPARWAGRVLTALPTLFLAFDVTMKLMRHPAVVEASTRLGMPVHLAPGIGTLLGLCLVAYLIPRTAPIGAVLLTGYLGGAIFAHVRIGDPLLSHTLFPIYIAAMLWGGLMLRDRRARALFARRPVEPAVPASV
jgi:hypothetical protein